ncbi:ganglioside GM2 activator-like [Mizuhopecten yessoensis]|uniref:Ganglioside GM2 activator n=1 Tax=Mizuhopecten yessoensis TaxID=6573 RepID=A0A210QUT8_MIZYE|nr:ganglioside GM2 activator-like [Mizuhopecten yessoensis]XP_021349199.1 ganglioside GM2 activator-like [Mizuhopecten yessoensis]XP_021349200.1 ganglioside GM2 activator-like [Mizuhopecten yessoensis]OWF52487.1 Ganglioside GM2 activator [Mizuhopecten yessoensis]
MFPSVFTTAPVLVMIYVLCPVSAFYVNDCMPDGQYNSDNVLHVSDARIGSTYVVAPGNLRVTVDFEILQNVDSELELSVVVKKKVWFFWATGHRSTHSLCDVLDTAFLQENGTTTCPTQLSNAGIPCRCPFTRGRYTLPWTSFEVIKPDDVPYGNYWAEARLTDPYTGELKACHSMGFYLSSY